MFLCKSGVTDYSQVAIKNSCTPSMVGFRSGPSLFDHSCLESIEDPRAVICRNNVLTFVTSKWSPSMEICILLQLLHPLLLSVKFVLCPYFHMIKLFGSFFCLTINTEYSLLVINNDCHHVRLLNVNSLFGHSCLETVHHLSAVIIAGYNVLTLVTSIWLPISKLFPLMFEPEFSSSREFSKH